MILQMIEKSLTFFILSLCNKKVTKRIELITLTHIQFERYF